METRLFGTHQLSQISQLERLSEEQRFAIRVVATVLPFRVNHYVIDQLIDWDKIPQDPMFQLCFPQDEMLSPAHFNRIADLLRQQAPTEQIKHAAQEIHKELNPHPANQQTLNVPRLDEVPITGMQHKYRETVLYFPSQGQFCFSYCTFCFRWPQFVGEKELRIAATDPEVLFAYLRRHPEVTDLLITGGDPLVMSARRLEKIVMPLLKEEFSQLRNIRIGSKALSYWPYRFLTDQDSDDLLRLFECVTKAGKHMALMVHFNHWREMQPEPVRKAISRIQGTGAVLRTQSPLLRHINAASDIWQRMWQEQVQLGLIPYYMFIVRDTGPRSYFEVPLVEAWNIYRRAVRNVSGLARTVRGPSMSAGPGKVEIQGAVELTGEKALVLRFIQGRNPEWVQRPFLAGYDESATWLDQLKPAFGEERFFYEEE